MEQNEVLEKAVNALLAVSSTFSVEEVAASLANREESLARQGRAASQAEKESEEERKARIKAMMRQGKFVPLKAKDGSIRYTTEDVLEQENTLIRDAQMLKGRRAAVGAWEDQREEALRQNPALQADMGISFAAFQGFPSSEEVFEAAQEITTAVNSFPDLGILNGPPGSGKSTVCQSVLGRMMEQNPQFLSADGPKIYATSSNPKASAGLGKDLREGLDIQLVPQAPTKADDVPAYKQSIDRRHAAIRSIAMHYGIEGADTMSFSELRQALEAKASPEIKARVAAAQEKADKNKADRKDVQGKQGEYEAYAAAYGADALSYEEKEDADLCDAYIQALYRPQPQIENPTFEDMVTDLKSGKVPAGSYIIVDEAGLMGREDMHDLLQAASNAQVRLLLVGDNKQIPPQEAGHPFDLIVERVAEVDGREDTSCSLTTTSILRQKKSEEKRATTQIRNGENEKGPPPKGLYIYAAQEDGGNGSISFVPENESVSDRLVADYLGYVAKAEKGHDSAVVLTTTQDKADLLNDDLREAMKANKGTPSISEPFVTCGKLEIGTGDRIMFKQDMKLSDDVTFSAGAIVTCTTGKDGNVTFTAGKTSITLTAEELKARAAADKGFKKSLESAQYAFALPLPLAQGMSVDKAFLSVTEGDQLDGPNGLVAFTRHKKEMSAYVSQGAYKNIDAMAHDVSQYPKGHNASDYTILNTLGNSSEALRNKALDNENKKYKEMTAAHGTTPAPVNNLSTSTKDFMKAFQNNKNNNDILKAYKDIKKER